MSGKFILAVTLFISGFAFALYAIVLNNSGLLNLAWAGVLIAVSTGLLSGAIAVGFNPEAGFIAAPVTVLAEAVVLFGIPGVR